MRRKAFLKKFAGHLAQLYCGFSTLDTAMCSCFRCASRSSLAAYLKVIVYLLVVFLEEIVHLSPQRLQRKSRCAEE